MSQEQDRAAFEAWRRWVVAQVPIADGSQWAVWQAAIAHERARILAALPPAGYVDAADVRRVVEGER